MASIAQSRCPVCNADRTEKFRPFCSKRCSEIDLGRWLSGNYAIPTEEVPDDFDSEISDPQCELE
ncbi:MAG: DNA gyrase inhibitor YacG [Alphaproteobacteria bacterium MarineAlpha11_Bin1]|nr:MAG: DNA gyrase inhibitor YacG [Alphaproteobacteria bacterium MarineAlpha11_Bin1]